MSVYSLYDKVANLLAHPDKDALLNLKASDELQERMELLIEKSKSEELTPEESDELNHYVVMERLIRLAKIRALH